MNSVEAARNLPTIPVAALKRINRQVGGHWFAPSTMRFFDSRVSKIAFLNDHATTAYFWTSEQFHGLDGEDGQRRWSVRRMALLGKDRGAVDTVGQFQQYDTIEQAIAAAGREAARG